MITASKSENLLRGPVIAGITFFFFFHRECKTIEEQLVRRRESRLS